MSLYTSIDTICLLLLVIVYPIYLTNHYFWTIGLIMTIFFNHFINSAFYRSWVKKCGGFDWVWKRHLFGIIFTHWFWKRHLFGTRFTHWFWKRHLFGTRFVDWFWKRHLFGTRFVSSTYSYFFSTYSYFFSMYHIKYFC